ncbi:hypothetical protein PAESOLCIP111_02456 [Paenibacillus solanacearum]|uniref:Uncharacterized protein n=1 Tax=Paenibacillus solanacearum TaxID=2048548 RepID=A0A916NX64_9BACL|nr:hypothetical protein PAESOLCIP111_02456 [Paenibacillus solanacearum]
MAITVVVPFSYNEGSIFLGSARKMPALGGRTVRVGPSW